MSKKETRYQEQLIKKIKKRFPGAQVIKTDPTYIWSWPDLMVVWGKNWGALETKRDPNSEKRPNQDYYVDLLDKQSFSSFIDPECEEEVLDAMERSFTTCAC